MKGRCFDIRVLESVAKSHFNQSLQAAHLRKENDVKRQYEEREIHVEQISFTSLAFTIAGGMGKAVQKRFTKLADILAESRGQPKRIVTGG